MIKRYMGVRYDLARTYSSRFSNGLIHLLVYDKLNKCWYINCTGFMSWHVCSVDGLPESRPRNCIKCDPMIKRVFGK